MSPRAREGPLGPVRVCRLPVRLPDARRRSPVSQEGEQDSAALGAADAGGGARGRVMAPFRKGPAQNHALPRAVSPELYKVNPAPEGTAVGGGLSGGGSVLLNGPRRAPAPPLPYSRLPFARSHPPLQHWGPGSLHLRSRVDMRGVVFTDTIEPPVAGAAPSTPACTRLC